jgi:hypothetical protein
VLEGIPFEKPVIPARHSRKKLALSLPKGGNPISLTPHVRKFVEWIPTLRQAQGKLFAGMAGPYGGVAATSSAHASQMTSVLAVIRQNVRKDPAVAAVSDRRFVFSSKSALREYRYSMHFRILHTFSVSGEPVDVGAHGHAPLLLTRISH